MNGWTMLVLNQMKLERLDNTFSHFRVMQYVVDVVL